MDLEVKVERKLEEMSKYSPVFPIPDPYHVTDAADYGSDTQIHYFQVLGEARKHRNVRFINFKLQKPISKDESKRKKKKKKQKRVNWWRDAILYFRKRWPQGSRRRPDENDNGGIGSVQNRRGAYVGSISSPIYLTESRSGSSTPCRNSSRPLTPAASRKGEVEIPYVSLREFNMEPPQFYKGVPIYLVT